MPVVDNLTVNLIKGESAFFKTKNKEKMDIRDRHAFKKLRKFEEILRT
jgi:hypothetical protein